MVTVNQMLLLGGVAVGGYLIWTNQSQIMSFINGITNPAPAATASGSSSLNLTGGTTATSPVPSGCSNGGPVDPTTGLCSDGSAPMNTGAGLGPGPSPVATGVNNSLQTGIPPIGVTPTISGGADVGGAGVNSDSGPTFTDPITGQTYNPGTGTILSPGGSTQIPNFSPFVEPGVGSANLGPPGGAQCPNGTRWSQCYGQCVPAGILEPAPGDPRCMAAAGQGGQCVQTQMCMVGSVWDPNLCRCVQAGLQTGNPQTSTSPNICPNGLPVNPDGSCPTSAPAPAPTPAPAPAPAPTPTCPAGTYWNPVIQQCNFPVVTPTTPPQTQAPPTVTQAPPTPTTVTPPAMQVPPSTPAPAPAPAPSGPSTNCKCCAASPHNGNCHSECNWGKSMTTSKCTSCLACCGDYEGNACKGKSNVGYAYQGGFSRNTMSYANEGTMIALAANATSPVGRAIGKRYPTKRGARVTSRSQKVTAANPITSQIFARPYQFPNRVAVS